MDIAILFKTAFKGFKNNEKLVLKNKDIISSNHIIDSKDIIK